MPLIEIEGNKKIGKELLEYKHMSSSFENVCPEVMEMDENSKNCWSLNRTLHDNEMVKDESIIVSTTKKNK